LKAPIQVEQCAEPPNVSALALGALGVYGDGTSPLYTLTTAFSWAGDDTPATALGILSLVVWTLVITASIKYVAVVMRADNDGEGGILALMSLLGVRHSARNGVILLGILGAPSFTATARLRLRFHVLSLAVLILVSIFAFQSQVSGGSASSTVPSWRCGFSPSGSSAQTPSAVIPRCLQPYGVKYLVGHGSTGMVLGGGVPVRYRRRGALCGHGAIRPDADPDDLVRTGAADCRRATLLARAFDSGAAPG
jgi:KUP system potassium uptake protein